MWASSSRRKVGSRAHALPSRGRCGRTFRRASPKCARRADLADARADVANALLAEGIQGGSMCSAARSGARPPAGRDCSIGRRGGERLTASERGAASPVPTRWPSLSRRARLKGATPVKDGYAARRSTGDGSVPNTNFRESSATRPPPPPTPPAEERAGTGGTVAARIGRDHLGERAREGR